MLDAENYLFVQFLHKILSLSTMLHLASLCTVPNTIEIFCPCKRHDFSSRASNWNSILSNRRKRATMKNFNFHAKTVFLFSKCTWHHEAEWSNLQVGTLFYVKYWRVVFFRFFGDTEARVSRIFNLMFKNFEISV